MLYGSEPTDVAVDPHVVRRIGKDQVGLLVSEEELVIADGSSVATKQAMPTESPQVAMARDRKGRELGHQVCRCNLLGLALACLVQREIDLCQRETGERHVEVDVDQGLQ